ncbi:hypothetical protein WG906_12535 [Pedobacter sp. P351]|uniref:hypothetical protein n=1 Tax=Pedobacter superstes TaxID=3133441 RepID=UPI0030B60B62
MTEIKIEKKKPAWPLIVLAVAIIGLILVYFLAYNDREDEVVGNLDNTEIVPGSEITSYFLLIDSDPDSMSLSHEFTNDALMRLIQATSFTALKNNFDIKADLESARNYATDITKDPFETTHADKIRKAADILTTALVNLQEANYPDLINEATELEKAAAAIDPDTLTLEQKVEVKTFFRKAKDLLHEMNS